MDIPGPDGPIRVSAYESPDGEVAKHCRRVQQKHYQDEILFGYNRGGSIYALISLRQGILASTSGEKLSNVKEMVELATGARYPVRFSVAVDPHGPACVWSASFEQSAVKGFSIFSTASGGGLDLHPSEVETRQFHSLNTACVDQGDPEEGQKPPCTKPELLATSDLNRNGRREFWYVNPYMWDNGFAVAEIDESGLKLVVLVDDCSICSD